MCVCVCVCVCVLCQSACLIFKVGQNHIYTVYGVCVCMCVYVCVCVLCQSACLIFRVGQNHIYKYTVYIYHRIYIYKYIRCMVYVCACV